MLYKCPKCSGVAASLCNPPYYTARLNYKLTTKRGHAQRKVSLEEKRKALLFVAKAFHKKRHSLLIVGHILVAKAP